MVRPEFMGVVASAGCLIDGCSSPSVSTRLGVSLSTLASLNESLYVFSLNGVTHHPCNNAADYAGNSD